MTKPFYDVFVLHAYEDQNEFASTLALSLKKKGLKVWYSGFDLVPGTSISSAMSQALRDSKYGVIIISRAYLAKEWAIKELEALFNDETDQTRILSVLHKLSVSELQAQLPIIADRHSVSSRNGVEKVVRRILELLREKKISVKKTIRAGAGKKSSQKKAKTDVTDNHNPGIIVLGGKTETTSTPGNITIRNSKNKGKSNEKS